MVQAGSAVALSHGAVSHTFIQIGVAGVSLAYLCPMGKTLRNCLHPSFKIGVVSLLYPYRETMAWDLEFEVSLSYKVSL